MFPKGLLSFPLTAFTVDDGINLDAMSDHLEDQLEQKPGAVFVAAGAGEFTALSLDEYEQIIHHSVRFVRGRVPVFAGIGGGPAHARATASIAKAAGADGTLLLPPYLLQASKQGLLDHVRYVASAVDIPVIVYQRANAVFDATSALELLDIPNVIGLKDGHGDIELLQKTYTAIRQSGHERAATFGFQNGQPTAELSAAAYSAVGVTAYSSAVLNFAPDIARAFYAALVENDQERTAAILHSFYLPFAQLRDRVPGYAVSLIKAGANLRGLKLGSVRPPLVNAYDDHVNELDELIRQARADIFVAA